MDNFLVLGLMSGTSLDGLDLALCNFKEINNKWTFNIIKTHTFKYNANFKIQLQNAYLLKSEDLIILDNYFARFCVDAINKFLKNNKYKVQLIASHGHTIFHNPQLSYTKQIGNGEIIAKGTGIMTVFDFRLGDMALGGQAAPLVPIGDELLFSEYDACLNIGGFANISYKNQNYQRIAFDVSPANIILNYYANKLNYDYDKDGKIAESGKAINNLIEELNNLDYYKLEPPKSLSREWVENNLFTILNRYKNEKTEDILHSLIIHIGTQIINASKNKNNVLVTGGGAYNKFLLDYIRTNSNTIFYVPTSKLVEFKEAIIFAFLGLLRYYGLTNCLASVTGASRDSCSGLIANP